MTSTSKTVELLLRRVAAELDTDLEHLDPKDVMRYDREVYDACFVNHDPVDTEDFIPSVGACVTSMSHVLDMTQGVLAPSLRRHLQGVLRYLAAAEEVEAAIHRIRQMDLDTATGMQS